jgi:hypothetical protein
MVMSTMQIHRRTRSERGRLKEAVLATFCVPGSEVAGHLAGFSRGAWNGIQYWLDVSGMALYLFDRLTSTGAEGVLPSTIHARLAESLGQNQARTRVLLREAIAIAECFAGAGISFAFLKGATLMPDAVPDCALRWQTDLDLLIEKHEAARAVALLQRFEYVRLAEFQETIELRAGPVDLPSMANLYRPHTQRSLELHLASDSAAMGRMARARTKRIYGTELPALSPADILVQQATHLLKHFCSEHTRASWALEFWRNVQARKDDGGFWSEVRRVADLEPRADIALGVSLLAAKDLFGDAAPEDVEQWTVERLSAGIRLWVDQFARRLLVADSIGSKLYLILRYELQPGGSVLARSRRLLLPLYLPLRSTPAPAVETPSARITRYGAELCYFLRRLRFHFVEGARYAIEWSRWERRIARLEVR